MSHYHITLAVTEDELRIVRRDFSRYMEESDGFSIEIVPNNDITNPSDELQDIIKKLFARILVVISREEVH